LLLVVAAGAPGPVSVTVCASSYVAGDCCAVFTDTIQVKFCPGTNGASNFYVYQLKQPTFCDMAYCAVKVAEAPHGM